MLHIDRETYQSRVQGKPLVFDAASVDCYVPHEWTIARKDEWANWLVEMMQDRFNDDEDLAGEDGLILPDEDDHKLKTYALEFVNKFARMADPQTCNIDMRNRLEHYADSALDTAIDAARGGE